MEESLDIRFLYVEKGVPVSELMKCFPGYIPATIFRHVKRPANRPFDKQKINKGRSKKLSLKNRTLYTQKIGPQSWYC